MTREKHLRIVRNALKKSIDQGFTVDQMAEGIVNRFEYAMEEELEDADAGLDEVRTQPAPMPAPRAVKQSNPGEGVPASLLDPPEVGSPHSSIIIDPNSKEAQMAFADLASKEVARPIRLGPQKVTSTMGPKRYWQAGGLLEYVVAQTPPSINVPTEGRQRAVNLVRKVEVLPGVDLVKLSYLLDQSKSPEPSSGNSQAGEMLSAMPIDIPVSVNFSCYTQDQPAESCMEEIFTKASIAYRPKPDHIDSHAPRPMGAIRFDSKNPHDTTPPMPNPITGKLDWSPGSETIE